MAGGVSPSRLSGGAVPAADAKSKIAATVYAGPITRPAAKQLDFDQFFSRSVTIHSGDSVRWMIHGFHNIYFPALGQAAAPFVAPVASHPVSGVSDAAGAPFWFNGLPNFHISPQAAFPAGSGSYDGTSAANSGLATGTPPPFVLRFTRTGTFRYFCLVHPGMTGVVHVVAASQRVPPAGQSAAAALGEQRTQGQLASRMARVHPAAKVVLAGHDAAGVAWLRFFPNVVAAHVGDTVTFKMSAPRENHTVSIGPAAYTTAIEKGFTQIVPSTTGGPPAIVVNPLGAYPSDPLTPSGLPPFTGANHGNGFENSGLLGSQKGGPLPTQVSFKFMKAGTYHFECVIHQGMDGTIKVT
jgi:plastocyanin